MGGPRRLRLAVVHSAFKTLLRERTPHALAAADGDGATAAASYPDDASGAKQPSEPVATVKSRT